MTSLPEGFILNTVGIGIYIHIPFCVKKCPYCDFTSFTPGIVPEDEYIKALIREIGARKEEPWSKEVETIYFGGGTPSLLSPRGIEAILNAISKNFRIIPPLAKEGRGDLGPEVTLEANPGTTDFEKLKGYRDAGANRLSIGIQSLNDRLLSALGRIHTREDALNAYEAARKAGFENIGMDLIHSKAGETLSDWGKDLEEVISLHPEHISAYNLTVEEGTHFFHLQEKGILLLPAEEEQAEMFLATREILGKAGYEHYEVSNYALPGFRSRHNQMYWKGEEYLGFGVSAHSYIDTPPHSPPWQGGGKKGGRFGTVPGCKIWGIRKANTASLGEYFKLINEKGTALVDEEVITEEKAIGEAVFLGLRMMEGIDLRGFEKRFGVRIEGVFSDALKELTEKRLLKVEEGHLRLTEKGLLFLNEVSVRFI